jgi:hypothetical protein
MPVRKRNRAERVSPAEDRQRRPSCLLPVASVAPGGIHAARFEQDELFAADHAILHVGGPT